jgi:adenylate cyclase
MSSSPARLTRAHAPDKFASVPGLASRRRTVHHPPCMGTEIERKFLVKGDGWRARVSSTRQLRQGYLAIDGGTTVRVRTDGRHGWLTVKGRGEGISRPEFEYEIPAGEADAMLSLCRGRLVEKTRHLVGWHGHTWEVDEFAGANAGLIVAELELREETEVFTQPAWLGEEVTTDPLYLNASLAVHPFSRWER